MNGSARPRQVKGRINGFDLTVIAGGAVNLAVVLLLLGYWLLH